MEEDRQFRLDLDNEEYPDYIIGETLADRIRWRKYDTGIQIHFNGETSDDSVYVSRGHKDGLGIYLAATNRMAWETDNPDCKISQQLRKLWQFLEGLNLESSPIRA